MSRSGRLRAADVAAVYQLLGECRELGADARVWQRHMLAELARMTGCPLGGSAEVTPTAEGIRFHFATLIDIGWTDEQRQLMITFLRSGEFPPDPFCRSLSKTYVADGLPLLSRARQQLFDNATWRRSKTPDTYRLLGVSDIVMALVAIPTRTQSFNVGFTRGVGDRPVPVREAKRLELFCRLIRPHLGRSLALIGEPGIAELSERRRQVLAGLLDGMSEKQIARKLTLALPTVHEYVTQLYRHFGVSARGELLAWFLRRHSGPPEQWIDRFRLDDSGLFCRPRH